MQLHHTTFPIQAKHNALPTQAGQTRSITPPTRRKPKRKALTDRHLAVLRQLRAGMVGPRRFVARSFGRLAEAVGCSYHTARNACARLEELGLITKVRGGGGNKQANAWIIRRKADQPATFCACQKRRAKYGNKERSGDLKLSPDLSFKPKTKHQGRETAGDKSPRSTSTATSTADRPPLPLDDADLNAYLSFATAFMAGTCTQKVRRAFFAAYRAGADKAQLLPAYRAHTALCLRRKFGLKRPDRFLLDEAYLDDWSAVVEEEEPAVVAQGPSAQEREAEHQAKLEQLRAQNRAAQEEDESVPADPQRVMAIIGAAVASKTPAPVRRTPSRVAVAEMTAPKPVAAPIDEPWETYWARAQKVGITEDTARRSWEGNRAKA